MQFSRCGKESGAKVKLKKPHRISGDYSLRVPPVPIPNTEVKPQHADSTWLETAREGRSSPDSIKSIAEAMLFSFVFGKADKTTSRSFAGCSWSVLS